MTIEFKLLTKHPIDEDIEFSDIFDKVGDVIVNEAPDIDSAEEIGFADYFNNQPGGGLK